MAKALLKDLVPKNKAAIAAGAAGIAAMQPEDSEAVILRAATPTVRAAPRSAYKATEENMQMALDMFDEGIDPKEIYAETGFFKGADGILRFEVSDKGVVYKVATEEEAMGDQAKQDAGNSMAGRRFRDVVDHPAMEGAENFNAEPGLYLPPDAENLSVVTTDANLNLYEPLVKEIDMEGRPMAGYAIGDRVIALDRSYTKPELRQKKIDEASDFQKPYVEAALKRLTPEAILMHEQQHIIQNRMDLAGGGNLGSREEVLRGRDEQLLRPGIYIVKDAQKYNALTRDAVNLDTWETITQYRNYSKEGLDASSNLTGKRRLLVGNSYWYKYGDEIRSELGPEPKRHRPKRERENWLSSAWASLANKIENGIGNQLDVERAKAQALMFVKKGDVDKDSTSQSMAAQFDQELQDGTIQLKDIKNAVKRNDRARDKLRENAIAFDNYKRRRAQIENLTDQEYYDRLAGEVEARNVENRLGMSQEELYASYPRDTEDVARGDQIVTNNPTAKPFMYGAGAAVAGAGMLPKESQAAFAEKRDQKNTAWTQLKDAVGGLDPSFKQLSQLLSDTAKTNPMLSGQREIGGFLANSLAGMGSGFMGAAAYNEADPSAMDYFSGEQIEGARDFVRNIPQAIGLGSMEENLINQALMDAMQGVGDAVSDTAAYQAFVEPALQDIAPDAMEFYEGLDPRVQGQLSGIFEYIGNAIR